MMAEDTSDLSSAELDRLPDKRGRGERQKVPNSANKDYEEEEDSDEHSDCERSEHNIGKLLFILVVLCWI